MADIHYTVVVGMMVVFMVFRGLGTRTALDSIDAGIERLFSKVGGFGSPRESTLGSFVRSPFPFCAGFYATLNHLVARSQRAEA